MNQVASFDTPMELALPSPAAPKVILVRKPVWSAHALIVSLVTNSLTTNAKLRSAVQSALGSEGLSLYGHIRAGRDGAYFPRSIVPDIDLSPRWAIEAGDAVGDLPTDVLVDELLGMRPEAGRGWDAVIDNPRPWQTGIAQGLTRVGTAITSWWQDAAERLAVEEARFDLLGSSVEGRRAFVNELSPSVRLDDDALRIKWIETVHEPAGNQILLTPTIDPGLSSHLIMRVPAGTAFGYPMQAGLRPPVGPGRGTDRLASLLGPARAQILRSLDRPMTYSQLAEAAKFAISTISHHLDKLIEAGLVVTMRLSRHNWVIRSHEGERLLELFG